ncbi:hypothetical protein ABPG73_003939 [Tetrahymena malaccensis]
MKESQANLFQIPSKIKFDHIIHLGLNTNQKQSVQVKYVEQSHISICNQVTQNYGQIWFIPSKFFYKENDTYFGYNFYHIYSERVNKVIFLVDETDPCYKSIQFDYQYQILSFQCPKVIQIVVIPQYFRYQSLFISKIQKIIFLSDKLQQKVQFNFNDYFYLTNDCQLSFRGQNIIAQSKRIYSIVSIISSNNSTEITFICQKPTFLLSDNNFKNVENVDIQYYYPNQQLQEYYILPYFFQLKNIYHYDLCFQGSTSDVDIFISSKNYTFYLNKQITSLESFQAELYLKKVNLLKNELNCIEMQTDDALKEYEVVETIIVFSKSEPGFLLFYQEVKSYLISNPEQPVLNYQFYINDKLNFIELFCPYISKAMVCLQTDDLQLNIQFDQTDSEKIITKNNNCQILYFMGSKDMKLNIKENNFSQNSLVSIIFYELEKSVIQTLEIDQLNQITYIENRQLFQQIQIFFKVEQDCFNQDYLLVIDQELNYSVQVKDQDGSLATIGFFYKSKFLLQQKYLKQHYEKQSLIINKFSYKDQLTQILIQRQVIEYKFNYALISNIIHPIIYLQRSNFQIQSNIYQISSYYTQIESVNGQIINFTQQLNDKRAFLYMNQLSNDSQSDFIEIIFNFEDYNHFFKKVHFYMDKLSYIAGKSKFVDFKDLLQTKQQFYYFWGRQDENKLLIRESFQYKYIIYQDNQNHIFINDWNAKFSNLINKSQCEQILKKDSYGIMVYPGDFSFLENNYFQFSLINYQKEELIHLQTICPAYEIKINYLLPDGYYLLNIFQNETKIQYRVYNDLLQQQISSQFSNQNQNFLFFSRTNHTNQITIQQQDKEQIVFWDFIINLKPIKIKQIKQFFYFISVSYENIFFFKALPHQKYFFSFQNEQNQSNPIINYWFQNSSSQFPLTFNYDFQEKCLASPQYPIVQTKEEDQLLFFKIARNTNVNLDLKVNILYEYIIADASQQQQNLTKQMMFIFFDQKDDKDQFININISQLDIFFIPCFQSINYINMDLYDKFKFKTFKSNLLINKFQVQIYVNKLFRFTNEELQQSIQKQNINESDQESFIERQCLWIEQKNINYEEIEEKQYFNLQQNEDIIVNLNQNELLQENILNLKQQNSYYLIKFKNVYFVLIFMDNNDYLKSLNSEKKIIMVRFFDLNNNYIEKYITQKEKQFQIQIKQPQFIEIDIIESGMMFNIISVQSQISKIISNSYHLAQLDGQTLFVRRLEQKIIVIIFQDLKEDKIKSQNQLFKQDKIIYDQDIPFQIDQVNYYSQDDNAGYILKMLQNTQHSLSILYLSQHTCSFFFYSSSLFEKEKYNHSIEIFKKSDQEINLVVIYKNMSASLFNYFREHLQSQIIQCTQIIYLAFNKNFNYMTDLSDIFYQGEQIEYKIIVIMSAQSQNFDFIIYTKDQGRLSQFTLDVEIRQPKSEKICQENVYLRNNICIHQYDQMIQFGSYKLEYQLKIKCISVICRTMSYFHLQSTLITNKVELTPSIFYYNPKDTYFGYSFYQVFYRNVNKLIFLVEETDPCYKSIEIDYQNQIFSFQCSKFIQIAIIFLDENYFQNKINKVDNVISISHQFQQKIQFNRTDYFYLTNGCQLSFRDQNISIQSKRIYSILSIISSNDSIEVNFLCQKPTFLLSDKGFQNFFDVDIQYYYPNQLSSEYYIIPYLIKLDIVNDYDLCLQVSTDDVEIFLGLLHYSDYLRLKLNSTEEFQNQFSVKKVNLVKNELNCIQLLKYVDLLNNFPDRTMIIFSKSEPGFLLYFLEVKSYQIDFTKTYISNYQIYINSKLNAINISLQDICKVKICLQTDDLQLQIEFFHKNSQTIITKNNYCSLYYFEETEKFLKLNIKEKGLSYNSLVDIVLYQSYKDKFETLEINQINQITEVKQDFEDYQQIQVQFKIDQRYFNQDYLFKIDVDAYYFSVQIKDSDESFVSLGFFYKFQFLLHQKYLNKTQEKQTLIITKNHPTNMFYCIMIQSQMIEYKFNYALISNIVHPILYLQRSNFQLQSNIFQIYSYGTKIYNINRQKVMATEQLNENIFIFRNQLLNESQSDAIEIIIDFSENGFLQHKVGFYMDQFSYILGQSNFIDFSLLLQIKQQFYYFWDSQDDNKLLIRDNFQYKFIYYEGNQNHISINNWNATFSDLLNKTKCEAIFKKKSYGIIIYPGDFSSEEKNYSYFSLKRGISLFANNLPQL